MNDSSSNDSDSSFDWNDPDINPSVRQEAIAFRDAADAALKLTKSKSKSKSKPKRKKSSIKKFVNTIKKKFQKKGGKRKNKTKKKNIKY